MKKTCIRGVTRQELKEELVEQGFKAFNSTQVFEWLYRKGVDDLDKTSNLSKDLIIYLKSKYKITEMSILERNVSEDETEKYLFELEDGNCIETVLIPEPKRKTLCISTQVGCKRKCAFCVSGREGFIRDLTPSEIVNQVIQVNKLITPDKITNIVFMGVGEPLDNFDNLFKAIDVIRDEKGIHIGKRKISISSCGVVPAIDRMITEKRDIRLSISLHTADDALRSKLMPINKKFNLGSLMKTLKKFTKVMAFPVFFEYILIKDLNSSVEDAKKLVKLLKNVHSKVNLIPYNPSPHYKWQAPSEMDIKKFCNILEKNRLFYTLRRSRGQDIEAACGQLRAEKQRKK